MGAIQLNRKAGISDLDFYAGEFGSDWAASVKATAKVGNMFYAVREVPAADKEYLIPDDRGAVRYCVVIRTHRGKGFYNFTYSDCTEFAGPCVGEDTCPAKLLDILSPIRPEALVESHPGLWAQGWRDRCRANAEAKAKAVKPKDLVEGRIYNLSKPITFQSGVVASQVRFAGKGGRTGKTPIWRRACDGARVSLSRAEIALLTVA